MELNRIYCLDCLTGLHQLEDNSVDLCMTSPPYFNAKEYSQWVSYEAYLEEMKTIFAKVYLKLKPGRMCCVNISTVIQPREHRNSESKRMAIPFHFVSLMEGIGFKFLEDIVWVKPEGSCKNRNGGFYRKRQPLQYKPNVVTEYILVFQKPMDGLIDKLLKEYRKQDIIYQNSLVLGSYERTNVWYLNPCVKSSHPAPFPLEIPHNIIQYYSFEQDIVLDPFMGSGTTAIAALKLNRRYIGFEKEPLYVELANQRIKQSDKDG